MGITVESGVITGISALARAASHHGLLLVARPARTPPPSVDGVSMTTRAHDRGAFGPPLRVKNNYTPEFDAMQRPRATAACWPTSSWRRRA